ncbi:MAG: hypothetical protein A2539_06250 [Elusimicrobia bacterium RIFOXYD2_FULL_34_15]|nr:MAG: hypothetical protein A2539_06250 [Elusimicrobia bacterium RIFOXYD2_FULL_34_15]
MNNIDILKYLKTKENIWIVGGYIRDLYFNKISEDMDFVTDGNTQKVAQTFAEKVKGKFIILDDFNKIYRVIINGKTFDFSKMQGKNIIEDLTRRDFTINAIAIPITQPVPTSRDYALPVTDLIDPYDGRVDIKNKVIRCIEEKNFVDDPLRVLRAYRFAGQLNFKIEPKTEKFIKKYAKYIKKVSVERISYELNLIMGLSDSHSIILKMHNSKLLDYIFPELIPTRHTARCYYPKMGLLGHCFDSLKVLEKFYKNNFKNIFPRFNKKIMMHLDGNISRTVKRKTILKYAVLLHDIGKPGSAEKIGDRLRFFGHEDVGSKMIDKIGKRLRFSNDEIKYIKKVIQNHMRLGNLTSAKEVTDKAVWRFFKDLGEDGIDQIVLSICDAYTYPPSNIRTLHRIVGNKLLNKYFYKKEKILPVKLLNGNEIMKILKIEQGPEVGQLLKKLEESQVTKEVKTREEAIKFLKTIVKTK